MGFSDWFEIELVVSSFSDWFFGKYLLLVLRMLDELVEVLFLRLCNDSDRIVIEFDCRVRIVHVVLLLDFGVQYYTDLVSIVILNGIILDEVGEVDMTRQEVHVQVVIVNLG